MSNINIRLQNAYEEKHETNCLHHNEEVRKDSTMSNICMQIVEFLAMY